MDDQYRGPSLLESLWRFRLVVVAVTLFAGAAAFLLSAQQDPVYEATARLFLTPPGQGGPLTDPSRQNPQELIGQQTARASSRTVLQRATDQLGGGYEVRDLRRKIEVTGDAGTLTVQVTATDGDPVEAVEIANEIAQAYRAEVRENLIGEANEAVTGLADQIEQIDADIARLTDQLTGVADDAALDAALNARIDNLVERQLQLEALRQDTLLQAQLTGDGVDLFEPAAMPFAPAAPNPRLWGLAGAVLGFAGSALWAYWHAARSQRVTRRSDPQKILGVPALGEVPAYDSTGDRLADVVRVDPAIADAYEFVLASTQFALSQVGGRSLLITSPLPADGKTSTVLQLAIAASRDGRRVVVVDADLRARGLSRMLQADGQVGLAELASGELERREVTRRYRFSAGSQLPVVTAGRRRGDFSSVLRSPGFRAAMHDIAEDAELTIVDSSPLLAVADATVVASSADAMVLVVSHGTPFGELERVRERLQFVPTPLLGYVYNKAEDTATGYGYGYGYEVAQASEDAGGRGRHGRRRSRTQDQAGAVGGHPDNGQLPDGSDAGDEAAIEGRVRDELRDEQGEKA